MDDLVSSFVAVALFYQGGLWNTKSDPSIDASSFETGFGSAVLSIGMEGDDLVSEKASCASSCVSDESFLLRQVELESFS